MKEYFKKVFDSLEIAHVLALGSLLIALWSSVGNILGLNLVIPSPYNWIVFVVFVIITLVLIIKPFCKGNSGFKVEKTENLRDYLDYIQDVTLSNNKVISENSSFKVDLRASDYVDTYSFPDVMQKITITNIVRVICEDRLDKLSFIISTDFYTNWKNGMMDYDIILTNKDCQAINPCEVHFDYNNLVVEPCNNKNLYRIYCNIPNDICFVKGDTFKVILCMKWNVGYRLKDKDMYYTDTQKFLSVENPLEIVVSTDLNTVFERNYILYEVSRYGSHNSKKSRVKPRRDIYNKSITWNIRKCDPGKVYVVYITRQS